MPATYTYPGVYVEEIPSGVRPIVGVSTSDTAFVDFFSRGPLDEPQRVTSIADFERKFGGLHPDSEASYAIQLFFVNGGSVAWVVRTSGTGGDKPTKAKLAATLKNLDDADALDVEAASEGTWGNNIEVSADNLDNSVFNLLAREKAGAEIVRSETHLNLSMDPAKPRFAEKVVAAASQLVRVKRKGTPNLKPIKDTAFASLTTGSDGKPPTTGAQLGAAVSNLDKIAPAVFSLLCLPGASNLSKDERNAAYAAALDYCEDKRAFLVIDVPPNTTATQASAGPGSDPVPAAHKNAAIYFPRLTMPDALAEGSPRAVGASGAVAGIYARTDAARGVWKAPAGTDAILRGAEVDTKVPETDSATLNPVGVNAIRTFPIFGTVIWGARTLEGADQKASEWKYVPVRRTALYIEESLYQGLKWVVFEPNDEPLWSQIRLNVGAFMQNLFRQGAFQGATPRDAYFVKCDGDTTTQDDIDRGVVNILVGFRPLKPAEFVVLKIQQMAGQTAA